MDIHFYKYQGTGNDFIILDNRDHRYSGLTPQQVSALCHRRFGIGADGLMLLSLHPNFDFEMKYYNSDGNESTMCGNGGRCITAFAAEIGIAKESYSFTAIDGQHTAIRKGDMIRLKMNDVHSILPVEHTENQFMLHTGSPHYVKYLPHVDAIDVEKEGAAICNAFEGGINVNFVEIKEVSSSPITLNVRTYERGVFAETWSCGTGSVAAALVHNLQYAGDATCIQVCTKGGDLEVSFQKKLHPLLFSNIWLTGYAKKVYQGVMMI